jgi:hypothetical protein
MKILLILFAVFALFGVAVIGGVVYLGYRAKEKVAELQQEYGGVIEGASDSAASTPESFPASQGSGCPLLEGDEAGAILGVAVERVDLNPDGPDGSEECQYWVSQAERQRLQRETISSGFNGLKDADPNSAADVEKLVGGVLGALAAAGEAGNGDFAFSLQSWSSGGQAMWDKMEAGKAELKNATGLDFAGMATEPVEGVGDRATVLPAGHSIMVLKGDAYFMIGFQQFVPGREKTIALAQMVAGRI